MVVEAEADVSFSNRQLHDFTFTIYKALWTFFFFFLNFKSAELVFGENLFILYRTNKGIVGCKEN